VFSWSQGSNVLALFISTYFRVFLYFCSFAAGGVVWKKHFAAFGGKMK
jgi:hypothetical protein